MKIILTGFMGAGKTTLGKVLARRLALPLFDTDQCIERQAAASIARIFEQYGEEEFRRLETELLKELWAGEESCVVSAGGGLPLKEENRALLKEMGTVVYLRVRPDTVLERLKGDTSRPLLQAEDVKERVESLLERRGSIYEEGAHMVVDVDGKQPESIGEEILDGIEKLGQTRRR